MKTTTKRNYSALYAIVGGLNTGGQTADEFIADRVYEFTAGRTTHKSEMRHIEYGQMVAALSAQGDIQKTDDEAKADKARKRVMAAIGGWLKVMGIQQNAAKIKAIACKAAKVETFNDIPLKKLRSIAAEFTKQQETLNNCRNITGEIARQQAFLN